MPHDTTQSPEEETAASLEHWLSELSRGLDPSGARYSLLALVERLLTEAGASKPALTHAQVLRLLYRLAPRFDAAGVFADGPWADPAELQVPLVAGTLRAPGQSPIIETLSELRMLAIARGKVESDAMSAADARRFLDEVMARNLRYLFPSSGESEQERQQTDRYRASHEQLFALIAEELGIESVLSEVAIEVEQTLAQRPISVWSVRRMILRARDLAQREQLTGPDAERIADYAAAAEGPSHLSKAHPKPADYRAALAALGVEDLRAEAQTFADSMLRTGLVAPLHASLVRQLRKQQPDLLPVALGLDDAGRVELQQNEKLAHQLIDESVFPTTAQCLYGLRAALERTLLSRSAVAAGLERLVTLDISESVAADLLARRADDDEVTARAVLVAGTAAVLGQPLGIGQGRNPTCQSARGISLWAQHDPAHLLKLIVAGARDGYVELPISGEWIRSDRLPQGVAAEVDLDLDPVSIVLVPHLDRLYSEFMRRSSLRLEDAHKWVNPALYGRWVPSELASAFVDLAQSTVAHFERFVRRFYATHHPQYNGGHRLMYPNPVGLVITNHQGAYLGPHAVSIQRVDEAPNGSIRVYFFNPNNEGRQDWGGGVTPTVHDNGEEPGESSLPFHHFASRLYAFHYNENEQGPLERVPAERVRLVTRLAQTTWGRRFTWLPQALQPTA